MSGIHPFGTDISRNVLDYIARRLLEREQPEHLGQISAPEQGGQPQQYGSIDLLATQRSLLETQNVEVGFTHKMMRVYLRATNLFTISEFKHWDPEVGSGNGLSYPTQRVINLGIQFSFNK